MSLQLRRINLDAEGRLRRINLDADGGTAMATAYCDDPGVWRWSCHQCTTRDVVSDNPDTAVTDILDHIERRHP